MCHTRCLLKEPNHSPEKWLSCSHQCQASRAEAQLSLAHQQRSWHGPPRPAGPAWWSISTAGRPLDSHRGYATDKGTRNSPTTDHYPDWTDRVRGEAVGSFAFWISDRWKCRGAMRRNSLFLLFYHKGQFLIEITPFQRRDLRGDGMSWERLHFRYRSHHPQQ